MFKLQRDLFKILSQVVTEKKGIDEEERESIIVKFSNLRIVPLPPPPGSTGESLKGPSNKVGGERKALVSDEGLPIGEGP